MSSFLLPSRFLQELNLGDITLDQVVGQGLEALGQVSGSSTANPVTRVLEAVATAAGGAGGVQEAVTQGRTMQTVSGRFQPYT